MKYIFSDMESIRKYGVDEFLNNDSWPVSDTDFKELYVRIFNEYIKIIKNFNGPFYDICLVELSFIAKTIQILQANFVKNYCLSNNIVLKRSNLNSGLVMASQEWDVIGNFYKDATTTSGKYHRKIRRVVKYFVHNKHIGLFGIISKILTKDKTLSIGSYDRIKREFVEKGKIICDHCDWSDLLKDKNGNKFTSNNDYVGLVIDPFLHKVRELDSLFIDGIDFNLLKKSWYSRFVDIENIYSRVRVDKRSKGLLVTGVGNQLHKIIALSYQRSGVKVFCFHHGNNTGSLIEEISHQILDSYCVNFVLPSDGMIDIYKKNYSHLLLEKISLTKYLSSKTMYYQSVYNNCKNNKEMMNGKVVMLMGFPMKPHRYFDEPANDLVFKLSLELRLVKFLKNKGFYVIYKGHPERKNEVEWIFNTEADECIFSKFEDVWQRTNTVLFTYPSTTTFGYALNIDRKIILIDMNNNNWNTESLSLLQNRVDMVPAWLDSTNRIKFNKNKLLSSLNREINAIDTEFINKYMWS